MRKACLLLALIVLVVWLAHGTTLRSSSKTTPPVPAVANAAVFSPCGPTNSCCLNPGDSDPHWECFDGACICVSTCGPSVDCATCGCNPDDEWACINNGGYWDPNLCVCSYGCDPAQEAYCNDIGGIWDPFTCYCAPPPCNPGPEILVYDSGSYDCSYCDGEMWHSCDCEDRVYDRFCQNGSLYNETYTTTSVCYIDGTCGGGGGGDCWDTGDCWCDYDWGYCCDWDYCYIF